MDPSWLQNFQNVRLSGINCSLSDHVPLLVQSEEASWGPKPFRNIDAWFSHPGFIKMVEEEWRRYGNLGMLDKLKNLKIPLKKWNKESFGNIDFNIEKFEREIAQVSMRLEEGSSEEVDLARFNALKSQVQIWYDRKNNYWRQLSREKVIKGMDNNLKYFHAVASVRNRRKAMLQIKKGRRIIKSPRMIKLEVRNFFKKLYTQKKIPEFQFQQNLVERISEVEAAELERMPTKEEIKNAVWDCESSKAPGPDGFNFNFIKRC